MSWRRPGDERNDKRYFGYTERKEIDDCKQLFTIKGVTKTTKNTYIIPVIETNGENDKERTDECKKSFTINRVYKSQSNKYIRTIKQNLTKGIEL